MKNTLSKMVISILLSFGVISVYAIEQNDSIDTLQDQVIDSVVFVQSGGQLTVNNVTVTPAGKLTAMGRSGVVLNGPFEVQLGGRLELKVRLQHTVRYSYDASGNRISRRKSTE
jgi:hypothetical protein